MRADATHRSLLLSLNTTRTPLYSKGRGNWLLKPARIANGEIRFSARWKVRFSDGGALCRAKCVTLDHSVRLYPGFVFCQPVSCLSGFRPIEYGAFQALFSLIDHTPLCPCHHQPTADALIYRGDVLAGGGYSKATATITQGEILKPTTGITGEGG